MARVKKYGLALLICMGVAFVVAGFGIYPLRVVPIVGVVLAGLYTWRDLTWRPPNEQRLADTAANTQGLVGNRALTWVIISDVLVYTLAISFCIAGRVPLWGIGAALALTILVLAPWTWHIKPPKNVIMAESFWGHLVIGRSIREGWQIYLFPRWFKPLYEEAAYPETIVTILVDGPDVWTARTDPNRPVPDKASSELEKIERGSVLLDIALGGQIRVANAALLFRAIGTLHVEVPEDEAKKKKDLTVLAAEALAAKFVPLVEQESINAMNIVAGALTIDEVQGECKEKALKDMEDRINDAISKVGLSVIVKYNKLSVGEKFRQARERAAQEKEEINALLERRARFVKAATEEIEDRYGKDIKNTNREFFERLLRQMVREYNEADYNEKIYESGMIGALVKGLLNKLGGLPGGRSKRSTGEQESETASDDEDEEERRASSGRPRKGGR